MSKRTVLIAIILLCSAGVVAQTKLHPTELDQFRRSFAEWSVEANEALIAGASGEDVSSRIATLHRREQQLTEDLLATQEAMVGATDELAQGQFKVLGSIISALRAGGRLLNSVESGDYSSEEFNLRFENYYLWTAVGDLQYRVIKGEW